ncbi:MAG TPA: hypothetical protein VFE46_19580 [Pirellulales bacterium]|jgi:hypothetical protein|nr:hypothetical protein [Pirellulales bacterium]
MKMPHIQNGQPPASRLKKRLFDVFQSEHKKAGHYGWMTLRAQKMLNPLDNNGLRRQNKEQSRVVRAPHRWVYTAETGWRFDNRDACFDLPSPYFFPSVQRGEIIGLA